MYVLAISFLGYGTRKHDTDELGYVNIFMLASYNVQLSFDSWQ